jgi:hypothetical protein
MELKLDNQLIDVCESNDVAVQQVIERVANDLKDSKRVISEISVNGRIMAGMDDPVCAELTVGTCESVVLVSEEPRRLAHKVLYDIAEYMPKIHDALVETSNLIQSRKEEDGLRMLEQVTSLWSELYQGFGNALIITGLDLDSVSVKGKSFTSLNNDIQQLLENISDLVQEQRFLELSDMLEYELAPKMPLVEEGIYQLVKEIEKGVN